MLFDDSQLAPYIQKLSQHIVYFIGVYCDLSILQEREFLRRDRTIGLANDQFDRVHAGTHEYDFTVNSSHKSSFELAQEILDFIDNNKNPVGFKNLKGLL